MRYIKRIEHEIILLQQHYGTTYDATQCYNDIYKKSLLKPCRTVYIPVNDNVQCHYVIHFPYDYPFSPCELYLLDNGDFGKKENYITILKSHYVDILNLTQKYGYPKLSDYLCCPCCVSLSCNWVPNKKAIYMIKEYNNTRNIYKKIKHKLMIAFIFRSLFSQKFDLCCDNVVSGLIELI